ncbi:unnamed protein product [Ixodes persulcatus]
MSHKCHLKQDPFKFYWNVLWCETRSISTLALFKYFSKIFSKMKNSGRKIESRTHFNNVVSYPDGRGYSSNLTQIQTLLRFAFVKDYVITFVRLLLGVDQAPGSGFLSSMRITKEDLWIRTYGRLYQKLCSTTCEIPIGIYRTQNTTNPEGSSVSLDLLDDKASFNENIERQEISTLVRTRMQDLGLPVQDYDEVSDKRHSLSYVIINPNCDLPLEEGDIM